MIKEKNQACSNIFEKFGGGGDKFLQNLLTSKEKISIILNLFSFPSIEKKKRVCLSDYQCSRKKKATYYPPGKV